MTIIEKVDRQGYDNFYQKQSKTELLFHSPTSFTKQFKRRHLSPFYQGGSTKGYVRGLTVKYLEQAVQKLGVKPHDVRVLDAGCGRGELSVFLAQQGYQVIGVDISTEGCKQAERLAQSLNVASQCRFVPASLEAILQENESIDFLIGHAALHHFIKYEGVPAEFLRIMKPGAQGFFADSFGENKLYHLFHDKAKMQELGDVTLTRALIYRYFQDFTIELVPTDWFTMLDKVYEKVLPKQIRQSARTLSYLHFHLDRLIPKQPRVALYLSGAVMTIITKPSGK